MTHYDDAGHASPAFAAETDAETETETETRTRTRQEIDPEKARLRKLRSTHGALQRQHYCWSLKGHRHQQQHCSPRIVNAVSAILTAAAAATLRSIAASEPPCYPTGIKVDRETPDGVSCMPPPPTRCSLLNVALCCSFHADVRNSEDAVTLNRSLLQRAAGQWLWAVAVAAAAQTPTVWLMAPK